MIGYDEQSAVYPAQLAELAVKYATIPTAFSSISEAWDYMEVHGHIYGLSGVTAITMVGGPADSDIRKCSVQPYVNILEQWTAAFNLFLDQRSHLLTPSEKRDANILHLHQTLNRMSLEVSELRLPAEEQTIWDDYNFVFEEAITLAELVLNAYVTASSNSKASFSLCLSIVGPLYDITRRCRDPLIRRRAIEMLRTCRRREGLWDSSLALLVVERIVAIEEDDIAVQLSSDVPGWRRIFNVKPVFAAKEGRWYLHYERKARASPTVTVQIQEIMNV